MSLVNPSKINVPTLSPLVLPHQTLKLLHLLNVQSLTDTLHGFHTDFSHWATSPLRDISAHMDFHGHYLAASLSLDLSLL